MSGGMVFVIIVIVMFGGLIALAMGVKWWEVRKAAKWPSVEGKVVVSRVRAERQQPGDAGYNFHDTEMSNHPHVEYEFHVGARKHRGRRITIGEKTSAYELEA